jgi:hypothetical protein
MNTVIEGVEAHVFEEKKKLRSSLNPATQLMARDADFVEHRPSVPSEVARALTGDAR